MGRVPFLAICTIALSSCGYQFQGRHNSLQKLGVEKIYVSQFKNNTYRPGVEQLFSTAMVREIQKSRAFELVSSEKEADAVLAGVVTSVETGVTISKSVTIATKSSTITADKSVDVASEYLATVACSVSLVDRNGRGIFSQSITNNKVFPGATQVGDAGSTVSLVNESEARLAIQFLASQMMASVYQRMIDTF